MKRSVFRLLTVVLSIIAVAFFAGSILAQGNGNGNGGGNGNGNGGGGGDDPPSIPFNYQLHYASFPDGATKILLRDLVVIGNDIYAVGRFDFPDEHELHGFVYNATTGAFYDISTMFNLLSSNWAMSSTGILVGNTLDELGDIRVYWIDLLAQTPALSFLDEQFPDIAASQAARDVNAAGDILVRGASVAYIVNPSTGQQQLLNNIDPDRISDSGFVVGKDGSTPVRWSPTSGIETFEGFKINDWGDVNNLGDVCFLSEPYRLGGGTPCRISTQVDWLADTDYAWNASSLNDSGDVAFCHRLRIRIGNHWWYGDKFSFYHASENRVFFIHELVNDSFLTYGAHIGQGSSSVFLTEPDTSLTVPTPVIAGVVSENDDYSGERRLFFLVPHDP